MVNNQTEFNEKYPREVKEIEIKRNRNFQGELVIEGYSELKNLYLKDIRSIEKVTLKNLPQLKECTIWDCGVKELVIENCSQIKKLNVRKNLLTNLEFLKSLLNLEELEINGNAELVEILKPYKSDWKVYQKDLQELIELSKKPYRLLKNIQSLKEEISRLKEKQPVIIDNPNDFQKKYQNLKKILNSLLEKEQIKTSELISLEEKTKELNLTEKEEKNNITTSDLFKKIKEEKNDLFKLKKINRELEKKLTSFERLCLVKEQKMGQKEKELEELKENCLTKVGSYDKEKLKNYLEKLLKVQIEMVRIDSNVIAEQKAEIKVKLIKKTLITHNDLDEICQLQIEITQLKLEIQKNLNKIDHIFDINSVSGYIVKPNLKHLIGRGGYGEVYYGEWKLQEVAVKKLYLSSHNTSESDLKNVQKEISILKNLRNRYIIQYYDIYYSDQEVLIIMDYAENGTLTNFINDNKEKEHDWNHNTNLIKQMALGLAYIHQENIVHRDLKSMNVLLDKHFQVKISDFGLSRTKIISSSKSEDIKGTLRWMAPEVLKEKKYSEQSDIYSLGMVIWEIAAKCTRPFKNIDGSLIALHIIGGGKEVVPNNIPKDIQDLIQQCWKDNHSERVTLANILKVIESDKPITYTNHPSDSENLLEPQNEQFKDSRQDNIPKSVKFPASELQKVLEGASGQEGLYTDESIAIWHSEEADINKEKTENPEFVLQVEQSSK